jgi:hypothetical protein
VTDFFEPPPPPDPEEFVRPKPKPWHGAPPNVLGGFVPERILLVRTERAVFTIQDITAYETGFSFTLKIKAQSLEDEFEEWDPFNARAVHRRRSSADPEIDPELFRFGVQFADGSKATNIGWPRWGYGDEDEVPPGPVLLEGGGGGGGGDYRLGCWVWPLPPPGPVSFVCEWPARGVPFTRVEIAGERVREAAAQAEVLWPEAGRQRRGAT